LRFPIAANTRLVAQLTPQQRRFSAAQKAIERQNAARVDRVVRKMARTIESI
jgi:antitoxin (DNA-binding transcriptional repressor) of toxin-antitoxin stability system